MTDSIHAEQNEARTRVALETGIGEMPFGKEEFLTEEQAAAKREALRYFQEAYEAQMRGDLDEAAALYTQSVQAYPTAEAHTFLGWTYSFMSLTDKSFAAAMLNQTVRDHGDQWTILEARLHARYAGKYLVNSQSMVQSASI